MNGHDCEGENITASGGAAGIVYILVHIPFILILFAFAYGLLLAIF